MLVTGRFHVLFTTLGVRPHSERSKGWGVARHAVRNKARILFFPGVGMSFFMEKFKDLIASDTHRPTFSEHGMYE